MRYAWPVGGAVALVMLVAGAPRAHAQDASDLLRCRRTIVKQTARLFGATAKALERCESLKVQGKGGKLVPPDVADCRDDAKTALRLARASSKHAARIGAACGGDDKRCGTADGGTLAGEIDAATIGFPSACPDLRESGCSNAIGGAGGSTDCSGVASCVACIADRAVDDATTLAFGALEPSDPDVERALNTCQRAIGSVGRKFLAARQKILAKCWDGRLKGRHGDPCPDASAAPGGMAAKAAAKIDRAESILVAKICKQCGGSDRACDLAVGALPGSGGGDDLPPAAIGFAEPCPSLSVPNPSAGGGAVCGGLVDGLADLVRCVACASAFAVDCSDRAAVPSLAPYPAACNPPPAVCPSRLRLDAEAATTRLDFGWSGLGHDLSGPFMGRLTLGVDGCEGSAEPACGVCTLGDPLANGGGAPWANRRCRDRPWIACVADGDCTAAGAFGPCRVFLGPPLPTSVGGASFCLLTEVGAGVAGTYDTGTAETSAALPLRTTFFGGVVFPGADEDLARPCPGCVDGACEGGERDGAPCTVQGRSPLFGTALSLDCPPLAGELRGTSAYVLQAATTAQTLVLGTDSPACRAPGFGGAKCLCDTCNDGVPTPCHTNLDCPESPPGTPGICGGLRCFSDSGPFIGTPCGQPGPNDPACGGGFCGVPGELTRPNSCNDGVCTPNTPPDDDSIDEGVCASGPVDQHCSLEPYRSCFVDAHCACAECLPGQTCVARLRECFTDSGGVGAGLAVGGSITPGTSDAVLGGVFCAPASANSGLPGGTDPAHGLPGPGRVSLPLTIVAD